MDDKAKKYHNEDFDRQYAEYERKRDAKPKLWNRPIFYAAIGIALAFLLWLVLALTPEPPQPTTWP